MKVECGEGKLKKNKTWWKSEENVSCCKDGGIQTWMRKHKHEIKDLAGRYLVYHTYTHTQRTMICVRARNKNRKTTRWRRTLMKKRIKCKVSPPFASDNFLLFFCFVFAFSFRPCMQRNNDEEGVVRVLWNVLSSAQGKRRFAFSLSSHTHTCSLSLIFNSINSGISNNNNNFNDIRWLSAVAIPHASKSTKVCASSGFFNLTQNSLKFFFIVVEQIRDS